MLRGVQDVPDKTLVRSPFSTPRGVVRGGRTPCLRSARPLSPNIVKKWPENASREVKKSKIFLPHPPLGRDSSPRAPLGKPSEYAPESDPVKVEGLGYHEEGRNEHKLKRHYDFDE